MPAYELLDDAVPTAGTIADGELERLRILARTPAWGLELDDRVLPAEVGLDERAISFTKGCYPGQEPVARLHYRGHPNRGLRVLELPGVELPPYDAELTLDGKGVGRITSAVAEAGRVLALAFVRQRSPRTRCSSTAPGPRRSYTLPPRARSSGDRALPCGGRGRTFESCRAHLKRRGPVGNHGFPHDKRTGMESCPAEAESHVRIVPGALL